MKATAVFLLPLLLAAAGCHGRTPQRVISAIPSNTSDASFVSEHAGLEQEAALHHLSVSWNGPNRGPGISRQIALTERAIDENDFGIVLSPTATFAMNTVIERALAKGMPVVILGPPLPLAPTPGLSFVSNDSALAAQLAAKRVHALVGEQGEVGILGIDPMEPGSSESARAFESALATEAPRVRIVSRLVRSFSWGQSGVALAEALHEHPKIAAVYALDLNDVRGAVSAISALGLSGRIKIVGNNQALDLMYDMRHGQVDSLIVADMHRMGAQAVRNIVAAREHRTLAANTVLEPVLVTRENLDTEAVQQLLLLDWRPRS